MNDIIAPVVRRAILDLLEDIGGEHNDQELQLLLNSLGHRLSRGNVAATILWLQDAGLVKAEVLGPFSVCSILPAGRDVAQGLETVDGVSRHKTGD
jgi:hypothetical protein